MNDVTITVSGVAHNLNNQIMILLNSLDRITILFPDTPDARLALKAAERCAELTAQLLPQQRRKPSFCTASLREVISETVSVVRCILPPHNRIEMDCRTDVRIAITPADLQHALVNLCINAIDAMNGPGLIRIVAAVESDSVRISVEDTGPGVPEALSEAIFEPLFTTKASRGGCGLGLSRVREMIENLGGGIGVHNVFPHGACFRILLPLVAAIQ